MSVEISYVLRCPSCGNIFSRDLAFCPACHAQYGNQEQFSELVTLCRRYMKFYNLTPDEFWDNLWPYLPHPIEGA